LDAPRHLFLHTEKSIHALAACGGLAVDKIVYDSGAFQFWASELAAAGRPWEYKPEEYPPHHLESLEARARQLNSENDGDQAAFYLRRAGEI
jgi:hypothetical protein